MHAHICTLKMTKISKLKEEQIKEMNEEAIAININIFSNNGKNK